MATLQDQITAQLTQINGALSSGLLPAGTASSLSASAQSLQAYLDKIVLGTPLTASEQQDLQNNLSGSQTALLAAQAKSDQTTLFLLLGAGVLLLAGALLIRHHLKTKKS